MSKNILLAVCGGIAAYKTCELIRILKKQGHHITVALSRSATEFIAPQTFQALSGNPVLVENMINQSNNGMMHINATRVADIMLIAPATANTIAKIAHGIADNLITEIVAARNCPLVVAPAMNVQMWQNKANQRNIAQLQEDGIHMIMPAFGDQACGEVGEGRMQEAAQIADLLPDFWSPKPLRGKKILITAGATYEAIDPVRGITNISSGKMGVALARACRRAGAEVSLIHGNLQTHLPAGLTYIEKAVSARQMHAAVFRQLQQVSHDIFIAVAAVADFHVRNAATQKIKKNKQNQPPRIELAENPDILKEVAQLHDAPFCVGFAAESENLLEFARQKRSQKNINLLIANDINIAMGSDNNQIILIDAEKEIALPPSSKDHAADAIVARIADLILHQSNSKV